MEARMNFKVETITPQTAAEYLSHNAPNNRRIKRAHVEMLARDMQSGEFKTTHQGIAFDKNGMLIDGQHRLQAVLMAGVPVKMVVSRNCETTTLTSLDRGESRTLHDAFTILGGNTVRDKVLRNTHILAAMNAVIRANANKRHRMSASEAISMYEATPEIWNSIYSIMNRYGRKRAYETAAYYAAMVHGVSADDIKKFDRCMCEANVNGCEHNNVQIVITWRRYLDDLTMRHIRLESQPIYQTTQAAIWHFVHNTGVRNLRSIDHEAFDIHDSVVATLEGADCYDL